MSCCWSKYFSEGTANCGVPQNTSRKRFTAPSLAQAAELPLAFFPQFLDLSFDQVALQHAQVLQEKNPIQVIDLMAESPRQQILAANFKAFSL
jgi:hypothetical protein